MAHHQPHDLQTPLQSSLPNPDRRQPGDPAVVPAHVRAIGVELTEDDHSYIRGRLLTKLAKFARSIQRVSVRLTDVNGPRGGIDQVCSIKVVLNGLPSVLVTRRHASVQAAIDAALHAIEQAVRGIVGRRRMKPLRSRSAGSDVDRF
jgi:ribosome-associated translation inhibitor RaiA